MNTKTFSLAHVLSITAGRLVCPDRMGGIYDILNHLTGDELFTHVLPRAGQWAKPLLLEAFPELKPCEHYTDSLKRWLDSDRTPEKSEGVQMWLAELRMMFPDIKAEYDLPCWSDRWLSLNPIEELEGMMGKDQVITIATP